MSTVIRQSYGIQHYGQQGLGLRLFGKQIRIGKWLKKAGDYLVGTVATAVKTFVPIFGGDIAEKIEGWWKAISPAILSLDPAKKIAPPYEPTSQEQAILDNWLYNKFTPFADALAQELGAASLLTNPQAKLNALNAIENKINIAQDHIAVDEKAGLSADAQDIRQYLVYEGLRAIDETIKAMISKMGVAVVQVPVTFNANSYNMAPLFATTIVTSVAGNNYKLAGAIPISSATASSPVKSLTPAKATTTIKGQEATNPLQLQPLTNPNIKNTALTDAPNGGDSNQAGKSNKTLTIAALIAAGIITIAAIKGGKSKKLKTAK